MYTAVQLRPHPTGRLTTRGERAKAFLEFLAGVHEPLVNASTSETHGLCRKKRASSGTPAAGPLRERMDSVRIVMEATGLDFRTRKSNETLPATLPARVKTYLILTNSTQPSASPASQRSLKIQDKKGCSVGDKI